MILPQNPLQQLSGNNIKSCVNPHKHWALGSQIPDLIAK